METILPPVVTQPVASTGLSSGGAALPPLALVSVSGDQSALVPGQILDGQVTASQPPGTISVTTDQSGTLVLLSKGAASAAVASASTISLQVVTGPNGVPALRVLSIDGQALARPLGVPSQSGIGAGLDPALAALSSAGSGRSAPLLGFTATLIKPASQVLEGGSGVPLPAAQTGGLATNLAVGTTVTLRIRDVVAVPMAGVSNTGVGTLAAGNDAALSVRSQTTAATEMSQTLTAEAQSSLSGSGSGSPLQAGVLAAQEGKAVLARAAEGAAAAKVEAKGVFAESLLQADGTVSDPATGGVPVPLAGRVVSTIPGQRTIVETPIGILSMPASSALKAQALVTFDVASMPRPPEPIVESPNAWGPPGRQMSATLAQAVEILNTSGDASAAQKLMSIIPQLDSRMAATMSIFMKALDKGNARDLIKEPVVTGLGKAGGKAVAERLLADLDRVEKDASEPVVADGQWRAFTMPLFDQGSIDPVRLYVRQPVNPDDGSPAKAVDRGQEHRFVVDLDLSRLGRMQMDGLVQRTDKRFDLIIRVERPFTPEMRRDIMEVFATTLDSIGIKGGVTFQGGGRFMSFPQSGADVKPTAITI